MIAALDCDGEMVRRYLCQLDPGATMFTYQTFDDNKRRKSRAHARIYHRAGIPNELAELQKQGAGVFVTVNETDGKGRKTANIVRIRAVWQEDDEGFEGQFPIEPSLVVLTSEGKFHRYWLVSDVWPADRAGQTDFAGVMRRMVRDYGHDKSACDLARVLRLPGFWHLKGAPQLVQIVGGNGRRYTRIEILTAFPPLPAEPRAAKLNGQAGPLPRGEEIERVRDALKSIPNDDRADWVKVGMALKAHLGDPGFAFWCEWSISSAKFDEANARKTWRSFRREGVTIATVFSMARDYGWGEAKPATDWPRTLQSTGSKVNTKGMTSDGKETDLPPCSDEAIALTFAERHKNRLRYTSAWGQWLHFSEGQWQEDATLLAFDLARDACREAAAAARTPAERKDTLSAKKRAAVVSLAREDRRLAATVDQWDRDEWLLATPRETIDLRTMQARAHRAGDYITRSTVVAPGGSCPRWQEFIKEVTDGDDGLAGFLQRVAGYALTGDTSEHALFFGHGGGGNGKSVLINTLARILGSYHCVAPIETFTASIGERHPTDLAMLRGARLVTSIETEEGRGWAEGRIKALTGGDPIRARFMRQDFFEYTPQFKLLIVGNHRPSLRNVDEAIRRRLHLIPFTVTIPPEKRDPSLPAGLQDEWPGILQWMLDGCAEWQEHGLAPPDAVTAATAAYLEAEDDVSTWIVECCDRRGETPLAVLNTSWRTWTENSGLPPRTNKWLSQALETRGFEARRTRRGLQILGLSIRNSGLPLDG
jgi:putative DNA primase/helicase